MREMVAKWCRNMIRKSWPQQGTQEKRNMSKWRLKGRLWLSAAGDWRATAVHAHSAVYCVWTRHFFRHKLCSTLNYCATRFEAQNAGNKREILFFFLPKFPVCVHVAALVCDCEEKTADRRSRQPIKHALALCANGTWCGGRLFLSSSYIYIFLLCSNFWLYQLNQLNQLR